MSRTKRPSLPPASDSSFSSKVRETLQGLLGERGDKLDRAVTFRDLLETGIARETENAKNLPPGADPTEGIEGGVGGGRPIVVEPPAVDNLQAEGGFRSVTLTWDAPRYRNHGTTEIFRAANPSFSNAEAIARAPGRSYVDEVGSGKTRFYWARNRSEQGVEGPLTGPVKATTPLDPDYVTDILEDRISKSELVQDLVKPIEDAEQLPSKWMVRVGSDGLISGIGLYGDNGKSQFAVAASEAYFVDPNASGDDFDPGTDYPTVDDLNATKFIMGYASIDGQTRFAINVPAAIPDATITDAQIDTANIDELFVQNSATIQDAALEGITTVWELQLTGDKIESEFFDTERGFRLEKNGTITVRASDGRTIIDQNGVTVKSSSGADLVRMGQL